VTIRSTLFKRRRLVIITFFILFLASTIKAVFFPLYEADTTIIMVDVKEAPTSIETANLDMTQMLGLVRLHFNLLQSEPVLRSVVEKLRLYEDAPYWERIKNKSVNFSDADKEKCTRQIIEFLRKKYISLSSPPFTNLIEIKVKYKSAKKAAEIANVLVENYIDWSINFLHREVNDVLEYLDRQVNFSKIRLLKSEDDLKEFRKENRVISLPEEIKAYLQIVPEEIKERYQVIQATQIKLLELEVELSRLRELYTDDSPQVIHMRMRIEQLKEELERESKKPKSTEDYSSRLQDMPEKEIRLASLLREVNINETLYKFLLQEQEKSRLLKVKQTTENIRVVSPALVPLKPKGMVTNILLGGFLALLFSVALAFTIEFRSGILFNGTKG